eukprot:Ihof_evm2s570 gene=Ihof_evmTU2s570
MGAFITIPSVPLPTMSNVDHDTTISTTATATTQQLYASTDHSSNSTTVSNNIQTNTETDKETRTSFCPYNFGKAKQENENANENKKEKENKNDCKSIPSNSNAPNTIIPLEELKSVKTDTIIQSISRWLFYSGAKEQTDRDGVAIATATTTTTVSKDNNIGATDSEMKRKQNVNVDTGRNGSLIGCPRANGKVNMEAEKGNNWVNKDNKMYSPNQNKHPDQRIELCKDRVVSTIPKGKREGEGEGESKDARWIYPSPQMFYNAMKRKGWSPYEKDMEVVVAIHNRVNENTWDKIIAWESLHN